jgi:hypothetical protein
MQITVNRAILTLLVATGLVIGSWGADGQLRPGTTAKPTESPTDATIAKLIKALGDDDYRVREQAGRELAQLGEKVLPQMRAALHTTDSPEVQRRLAVLIRKLDHDRLVTPKTVTVKLKDTTVKSAFEEIARQTGYKIEYTAGGRRMWGGDDAELKHTFEFENMPFWVAVDKVASTAGCAVFSNYDDETIRVYDQESLSPYVAYAGPFRFVATNIHSNKSVQLSGINRLSSNTYRQEYMNLSFQIQSEPKNPMLGVTQAEVIVAVDEFGGSLVPPKNPSYRSEYYSNGRMRGFNTYGNLNLSRADKTATTIKTLKGKIGIILLAGTVPELTIPNPLQQKNQTFTGRSVAVDFGSLAEDPNNKGHYLLQLTVKRLGENDPNRIDYSWSDTVWQKIELQDGNGGRYHCFGPNSLNNNGLSVQMTLPFRPEDRRGMAPATKLGPPARLVINEWLSVTHEVTFEFKDIPLP